MSRLSVAKTIKMYVGGKFIRSESGRVSAHTLKDGTVVNIPAGSRKDLREALQVARAAQPGWAKRTAYNRGQILYRLAEVIDGRSLPTTDADKHAATDRAVHHAGWTDKITAVLSSLNPVSGTYINYSRVMPLGVVLMAPNAEDGLLGLVEAACINAVMGNAVILLVSPQQAELATALTECFATCDLPGGVVNVMYGDVDALIELGSLFDDLDGIAVVEGAASAERLVQTRHDGARVLRRIIELPRAAAPATPMTLQRLAEIQTVWMSAYEPAGGAAAY